MPLSSLENLGGIVGGALGSVLVKPSQGDQVDVVPPNVSGDDPSCKTAGVTDEGVIKSAKWKAIIAGTVTAYNTYNNLRIAKLQRDLGKKYLSLAEDHRNYYNEKYKPLEINLTQEASSLPKYRRDKEQFYMGQMLASVRGRNAGRVDKAMSCTGRYCTGQRAAIMTDYLLEQAMQESMVAGLGHRYADREEINHNNLRWEKRSQVLRIGRDIPTEAISYASLATGTFGSLSKQIGQATEGAVSFLGYERNATVYPERKTWNVGEYRYIPPAYAPFKPKPTENYTPPKPPETVIRLSG